MTTNTRSPGQVVQSFASKIYAIRNLCMYNFLKFHHNCDVYMDVQKERMSTAENMLRFVFVFAWKQDETSLAQLYI